MASFDECLHSDRIGHRKSAQCSALVLVLVKPSKKDRDTVAILLLFTIIV